MQHHNKKLLTVIIPTRNRCNKLKKLLEHILNIINLNKLSDVQIIVSDNSSDDNTENVVSFYKDNNSDRLSYVYQSSILNTTEEHISKLFNLSKSEWTMFISDETELFEDNFLKVIDILRQEKEKQFVVLDFIISSSGNNVQTYFCDSTLLGEQNYYVELLKNYGFYNGPSVIGSIIYRSELLDVILFEEILKNGIIFSHVAFNLVTLKNKRGLFLDFPIFIHETKIEKSLDYTNWLIYGKKNNRPILDPWMLNFYKLLEYLYQNNHINSNFLFDSLSKEISENSGSLVIPFIENMKRLVKRNTLFQKKKYGPIYSDKDIFEMIKILSMFKGTHELIQILQEEMLYLTNNVELGGNLFIRYFYKTYSNYEIYKIQNKYVAKKKSIGVGLENLIYDGNVRDKIVFCAGDINYLKNKIENHSEKYSKDDLIINKIASPYQEWPFSIKFTKLLFFVRRLIGPIRSLLK